MGISLLKWALCDINGVTLNSRYRLHDRISIVQLRIISAEKKTAITYFFPLFTVFSFLLFYSLKNNCLQRLFGVEKMQNLLKINWFNVSLCSRRVVVENYHAKTAWHLRRSMDTLSSLYYLCRLSASSGLWNKKTDLNVMAEVFSRRPHWKCLEIYSITWKKSYPTQGRCEII